MQAGAYSFLDVNASIAGHGGSFSLSQAGLAEEGITLAQIAPKNTMVIGANGDGMHSMRASRAVKLTVSLLKTGNGNAQLNAMYRAQAVSAANWGANVITITNPITGDAIVLTDCAFDKQTDLGYASVGNNNVWGFDCVDSEQILGDSFRTSGNI